VHRLGPRQFSSFAFVTAGIGTLLLVMATSSGSVALLVLAFLFWGFGFGSVTPLSEFMWAGYFGRRYLGAVRSASIPFTVAATSLGPLLIAYWFDRAGSYDGAFLAMAGLYAACAAAILATREPRRGTATGRLEEASVQTAGTADG
jgi:predicted MFS family arabinose efflux permease